MRKFSKIVLITAAVLGVAGIGLAWQWGLLLHWIC